MKRSIIVSHPGKQHVHQLLLALRQTKSLLVFLTTIWYKKESFQVWAAIKLFPFTRAIFAKRYFEPLDGIEIEINLFPEFLRAILGKLFPKRDDHWVFLVDRWHDRKVARRLNKFDYDALIAYENASLFSFKTAKANNKTTILDLAHVHHSLTMQVYLKYPDFHSAFSSAGFVEEMNNKKDEQNRYVDYFIALSGLAKESLLSNGISSDRIYLANPGFDPLKFSMKTTYESSIFTVLFVGSITRKKGVHLVIDAFNQLGLSNSRLQIVGPLSDAADCLQNLPSNIFYTPFVNHSQLAGFYQNADVFVFPSYLDSWAMVVLEAMACGTPVIISENTGAKDAVYKGGGVVIPVGDVGAIMEGISFFYQNPQKKELIGREANYIAQQFTWSNYHSQVQFAIADIFNKAEQAK